MNFGNCIQLQLHCYHPKCFLEPFVVSLPPPGNYRFALCHYYFVCSRISYKRNHTVCGLSCLTYFISIMFLRFVHVATVNISFFSLLSSIPFYEHTTICLLIHLLMDICVVYSFWLIWIMML